MSERQARLSRTDFKVFRAIPTRWHDNDVFGHVNNVVYYGWFDTAVNAWLIENGFLDLAGSAIVGLVVEIPGNASSHADAIVASIREITKLRGEVAFRLPGELPNDGKVIEDARKYS